MHTLPTAVGDPIRLANLPLFTPNGPDGLTLLADAASSLNEPPSPAPSILPTSLNAPGPFKPEAALPSKIVKRILNLDFVDMAEITSDDLSSTIPGRPHPPRLPITDISIWLQRYSAMAAVLTARFPHKAPELFAYQGQIVRAARNYEGDRWVAYDRQFRRETLARKDLDWSSPNHRLYNEAFTGWARHISRCSYCLQDDHTSDTCPGNPNMAWPHNPNFTPTRSSHQFQRPPLPSLNMEICKRFNRGRCPDAGRCKYSHMCLDCRGNHPFQSCPRLAGPSRARSRSPPARRPPPGR